VQLVVVAGFAPVQELSGAVAPVESLHVTGTVATLLQLHAPGTPLDQLYVTAGGGPALGWLAPAKGRFAMEAALFLMLQSWQVLPMPLIQLGARMFGTDVSVVWKAQSTQLSPARQVGGV
jgi:hypothetical protein